MNTTAEPCIGCGLNWALAPSVICGGCYRRMERDLRQTQWAHGWLGAKMTALAPAWRTGTVHREGEPQPPYDLQLTDTRAAIELQLGQWADRIAYEHVPALSGPADRSVPALGTWLQARLHWCSDQPWCGQYMYDLAQLRSSAYQLAPWDRQRQDLPLPCPKRGCGRLSLTYYGGSDGVTCRIISCGHTMTWADYLELVADWHRRNSSRSAA